MAVGDLLFAFDPSKESPESVKKKRAIAQAILATNRAPRTIGEGLNALGDGIVANVMNRRASEAEGMGQQSAQKAIAALIAGSDFGGSSGSSASGFAAEAPSIQPDYASQRVAQAHGDSPMSAYRDAIASIESAGSGDYGAVGPTNSKLGRALGRYQIMEANIGPWSREVLGREVTPDEFMANPQLQDAIFDGKFGGYVDQFGPEGAAQAWFAGPGGVGKVNRKDVLGTDVGTYGQKFLSALGPQASNPVQAINGIMNDGPVQVAESEADVQAMEAAMAQQDPQAFNMPTGGTAPQQPVQMAQASMPNQMSDAEALRLLGARAEPQPMQQAPQPMQMQSSGPTMEQLLQASQNPWLSESQRGIVNMLLQQQMQQNDPMRQMQMEKAQLELEQMRNPQPKQTDDIREYEFARSQGYQGTFQDFMTDMKRAGATNVTTNVGQGSSEYNKALDKKFAEQYITMQDGAQSARNKIATLQGLGSALDQTGYTGMGAESILAMKQAGRMLGLDIGDNLGPEETARALGNQLALQMRSPSGGAGMPGAMSDKDREFLVASVPGLSKTPEGNRRLIDYMMRIEERNIQVAQLAQAYADENGQIDNGFYKQLSEWSAANPMFPEQGGNTPKVYSVPEGIDPSDWEFMTPEEKALFQ